jgi:hypothetical protein
MCSPTMQAGNHLRVQTRVPAMLLPAGAGDVGFGRDASKKGGKHLASTLELDRMLVADEYHMSHETVRQATCAARTEHVQH